MNEHPVPRQITSFEFKLIGFLTLRQFGYVILFAAISFLCYFITPVPYLNFAMAAIPAIIGIFVVFVPYNDRPIDVWIKNFVRKMFWPSQYYYIKKNQVPGFLMGVTSSQSTSIVEKHLDAQQKLESYLLTHGMVNEEKIQKKEVQNAAVENVQTTHIVNELPTNVPIAPVITPIVTKPPPHEDVTPTDTSQPFLHGSVKNNKHVALPNILVYVKDYSGKLVRILKTNNHGVFATYRPLGEATYLFEAKDSSGPYFFDTMEIPVRKNNNAPIEFISRETL